MRNIEELICEDRSTWTLIKQWIENSNKQITILPVNKSKAEEELLKLQVTTKSPLGTVIYETGGILFDNGWLRFLGSGCDFMKRSLSSWNLIDEDCKCKRIEGSILIADDILGGFFALNGGAFDGKIGDVFYMAPETLQWESLNLQYSNFLYWACTGDMQQFYSMFRWKNWSKEILDIRGDRALSFNPPLWTENTSIDNRQRSIVTVEEIWNLYLTSVKSVPNNNN